ncbi:TonB-dependent receptor [Asticcacaulis sp. EMRT-3]|uniref:TonB-dependent receptor n=1 Tax=Asticcacaulis sp. EMRT-3 TaxID=3040349 RepID=UPI0024AE9FA7|nr:TonB-dependent receptor [Asticcacaulis sp. EMRT-3]MDI7774032.1 TonB-dependent receptor [Asticcacaulis sp. EMRT-3]
MTNPVKTKSRGSLLRAAFLGGASTMALCAFAAPTFAQDAAAAPAAAPAPAPAAAGDDSTVVVVTGIRGSLQRSMLLKKNSDGVVDGISAEDIGKYPDTNLADSLQRVTGVSINRVNGEGEQITVRGFGPGYNMTTVDGRIMPASTIGVIGGGQGADSNQGNSRAFDFSNIASDGVSAVQVYKTGRADMPAGGIGATINLQTLQPLAHAGSEGSITVKGLTSDHPGLGTVLSKKSVTPEISGAYQWTNDSGKFGIAAFGSYQEKTGSTRSDTVNAWNVQTYANWLTTGQAPAAANITNAPTNMKQLIAVPTDSRLTYAENDLKRTNAAISFRWKPTEDLAITANTLFANTKETEARSELTNWFSRSPYAAITFDGNSTIDSAISATDTVPPNKDQGYENELRSVESSIESTGLNVKYNLNDHWILTADLSSSQSSSGGNNPDGTSSTTVSVSQTYVASNTTTYGNLAAPVQHVTLNPAKSATGKQDIGSLGSGYSNQFFSRQTDKIQQAKFDATYAVDDSSRLSFGVDAYKNVNTEAAYSYQAQYGDWGGLNPGDLQKYGNTDIKTFCLACQFNSVDLNNGDGTAYRFNAVTAYHGLEAYYASPNFQNVLPVGTAKANTPHLNGFSHNEVEEQVKAAYAQFAMKGEFLTRPVKILAGVRYETTDVTVTAFQNIPTGLRWDQKNNFSVVQGTDVQPYAVKSHYSNLLPSIDMAMNITDDFIGRMSFSVTDARPQYSSMYATTGVNAPGDASYNGGVYTASSGNPDLKPLVSENFDLSAEWYYGRNSYVSLGYYRKAVQNFIGNGTTQTHLFGITDPASGAANTRSGDAVAALTSLGVSTNTNNLSAMTILIDQAGGNVATAKTEWSTKTAPDGHVSPDTDQLSLYLWGNPNWKVVSNSSDPLATFTLSQPINNHTANIDGFEFAIQHFFGDTGFGIAASATTVNGDVALDNAADPLGSSQFALEGLSNTYNVTGIYEKYGFEGRILYNWRDKYLQQANASQNGGLYAAAYGQWDASFSYALRDNISLTFEALNINKGHIVQYIRVPTDVVNYQELDSRYEFGIRYKF